MRILIVSTYFPPHVGGVEVVAQQQARLLAGAGHDVVVATTRSDPTLPADSTEDGFRVRRLPAGNAIERRFGVPYPVIGPTFLRSLRRLVRWCDVVHLHDVLYQPPQAAAVLAALAGRPVYATQHVGAVNHPRLPVRAVERVVGAVGGRPIYRRARRIVSYNPMVTAHLRSRGVPPSRIVRAAIGVDLRHFTPDAAADESFRHELGLPAGTPLVLFVGRMVAKKGFQHLLAAAGPGRHIVLVGSGTAPRSLPAGVTCTGPLPRERLTALYRTAALFVLPSTGEVFPIVAQEAMACGLPVVLTDSPHYDEYPVDRALLRLVPPAPAAVRDAIDAIVADPRLRRRMARYSRDFAERFFDADVAKDVALRLYDGTPSTPDREGRALWTSPSSS